MIPECKSSADVINERPRCSHDIQVMMRMLVSMMTWCQNDVYVKIMWIDYMSCHVLRFGDW